MIALRGTVVAKRQIVSCDELVVEMATVVDANKGMTQRIRFNVFSENAFFFSDQVMWLGNRLTTDLRLESTLWEKQARMVHEVREKLGLSDVSVALFSLFAISRGNVSNFLVVAKDTFVVHPDGPLTECDLGFGRDERIVKTVFACDGCRAALGKEDLDPADMAQKWKKFCETARKYYQSRDKIYPIEFVCRRRAESSSTISSGNDTSGTSEMERATSPVLAAVLAPALISIVAIGLFAVRGRLGRVWQRYRETATGY